MEWVPGKPIRRRSITARERGVHPANPLQPPAALGNRPSSARRSGAPSGDAEASSAEFQAISGHRNDAGEALVKGSRANAVQSRRQFQAGSEEKYAKESKEDPEQASKASLSQSVLASKPLSVRKAEHKENCEQSCSPEALMKCGTTGHSPRLFNVQPEGNAWKVTVDDLRSSASAASAASEYAAKKIAAAASFIKSLPHFGNEDLFLSQKEIEVSTDSGKLAQERQRKFMKGHTHLLIRCPEKQRLDDTLKEDEIREICSGMYDLVGGGADSRLSRGETLVIGSIEAALIAWDLTSEIQGAWRIPLTIVSRKGGIPYAYVSVLVHIGVRCAALGRSMVEELSYQPLVRQRVSDLVGRFVNTLISRGHEPTAIWLGMPTECPNPRQAAQHPVIWRYLKLSCERQEWASLLATCDLFISHRRAVRRQFMFNLSSSALPRGFLPLPTTRNTPRLKAGPPALARKRRPRGRKTPPLGRADPMGFISPSGVWKATPDELRIAMYGSPELPDQGNMEDCSSVSSTSLDEYEEDRALHLSEIREPVSMHSTRLSLMRRPAPKGGKASATVQSQFTNLNAAASGPTKRSAQTSGHSSQQSETDSSMDFKTVANAAFLVRDLAKHV